MRFGEGSALPYGRGSLGGGFHPLKWRAAPSRQPGLAAPQSCKICRQTDAQYSGRAMKIPGPTYREMLHPERPIRDGLFGITWRGADHRVRHTVLPRELTGIAANIVVLLGCDFPSRSHKLAPAYPTL